jgi:hypothetical protein
VVESKLDPEEMGLKQIERVESMLSNLGTVNERKYANYEKEILEGLSGEKYFENSQKNLGELLGFNCGKKESDGSPDPWWISGEICFVFEDHAGAKDTTILDATKARQASSHPAWMRENVIYSSKAEIIPVLVTPVKKASQGAWPHLDDVSLWPLEDFRSWAKNALSVIREVRKTFVESGDLDWRVNAFNIFKENKIDSLSLYKMIKSLKAKEKLTKE